MWRQTPCTGKVSECFYLFWGVFKASNTKLLLWAPLGVERASCVWCRISLPSGRGGAGCDSRFRCPSRWSAMTESSTPPPSPSPTPPSPGPDLTAVPLGPSCGHVAPLHPHRHLHPHPHLCWAASATATGPTAVVTRACRCCHRDPCFVFIL